MPKANSYDYGTLGIPGRGLVRSGNYYYCYASSWDGGIDIFSGPESQLVLARFDTAAQLNRTFVFGETGYRYLARHIESMKDGGVMLLGTRQNFLQNSGIAQRDYFAIRLDAAGNPLSISALPENNGDRYRFTVSPNPGRGIYYVSDLKSKLQEVSVYNMQGNIVCRQKVQGSNTTISIVGQPVGIYGLQIQTTDGKTEVVQILLQE